jgi:Zn-dependent peptidase ImmA (M78 family)
MATARVQIAPQLLRWAVARSGRPRSDLAERFPLEAWESGERGPTFKQLTDFATATATPIGLLFLDVPPEEGLPIADFRTRRDANVQEASADLLDVIYACQRRQEWYRSYLERRGDDGNPLVASADTSAPAPAEASRLRDALGFGLADRARFATWQDALSGLIARVEAVGILVMVNGVVGSNTHRVLDPGEFRGFTLADPVAPLIFINGADTKAAQIFTLAHEVAHVVLGGSGVSDEDVAGEVSSASVVEAWCNDFAAELLVPEASLQQEHRELGDVGGEATRLARYYKTSTLVVLRRLHDVGLIPDDAYRAAFSASLREYQAKQSGASGGNYYATAPYRTSRMFARAVIADAKEGSTLYRDAYRLLGVKKTSTFAELGERLGA